MTGYVPLRPSEELIVVPRADRAALRRARPLGLLLAPAAALVAALAAVLVAAQLPAAAASPALIRVSVSSAGGQGDGVSGNADRNQQLSGDGQVAAFYSQADGLTARHVHGQGDVVVRDLGTGRTSLASVSSAGALADGFSGWPSLDATGREVAFVSYADNLVPGDTNGLPDIFVRDRRMGTTTRVSLTGTGGQLTGSSGHPSLSADGRFVAFESSARELLAGAPPGGRGADQVYVRDLTAGSTRLASTGATGAPGNGESTRPSLSADGGRVAFQSEAPLVAGDTNGRCDRQGCSRDVFVHDMAAGSTVRASVRPDGSQGIRGSDPSISADGRRVAMLGNGLVPGDATPDDDDVYVRDLSAGTTTLVSRSSTGVQAAPAPGPPELSGDGRTVAFSSTSPSLVPGDTNGEEDVFVRKLATRTTRRVSVSSTGAQGDSFSIDPDVSADGSRVLFVSYATDLVPGDTNGALDVFVRVS